MKTELEKAFDLINQETVSLSDAASFLGCPTRRIYTLIETGKLKAGTVGPYYRIVSRSLDEYVESKIEKVK